MWYFSLKKATYLGLEPPLHEILNLEAEHVIQLHAPLIKHTDTHQATQQRVTCT